MNQQNRIQIMTVEKDEVDSQIKTIRPHAENKSSRIGFTCAVKELDDKR